MGRIWHLRIKVPLFLLCIMVSGFTVWARSCACLDSVNQTISFTILQVFLSCFKKFLLFITVTMSIGVQKGYFALCSDSVLFTFGVFIFITMCNWLLIFLSFYKVLMYKQLKLQHGMRCSLEYLIAKCNFAYYTYLFFLKNYFICLTVVSLAFLVDWILALAIEAVLYPKFNNEYIFMHLFSKPHV